MKAELKWLEDPRVFRINRLDAHSDHMYYGSEAEMEAGKSRFMQSLNGTWRFAWSRCPKERPADFFKEGYDTGKWDFIQVPGHMELQGYDKIHYINTMYPWEGHVQMRPPHIDWEYNPVGSYVTEFDLEDGLKEKRVCISFQGVEEAFYVWLNGQFVGYAEDTFTPSDFDLTPHIREKGNRLCVEVYKRSSAAWAGGPGFLPLLRHFQGCIPVCQAQVPCGGCVGPGRAYGGLRHRCVFTGYEDIRRGDRGEGL